MQPSKPRGPSELAKASSPSALRPTRGSPRSPDAANPKPSKSLERKLSSRALASPEKRAARVSEVQQQLGQVQEELRRTREEKAKALEEVREMKQASAQGMEGDGLGRIKMLEAEVEKAKDSETKMLESLVSQTKQLEGTKIELEEAKLEIRNLQESIRGLEGSVSRSSRSLDRFLDKPRSLGSSQSNDEVARLRSELRLAIEAEEKNKKAMDDLAFTLKEVTTEMNQVKEKLSVTQLELDRVREEGDHSKLMLMTTEEKLQIVLEEAKGLRLEVDESHVAWDAKENGFIDCMKVSEEEITKLKQENCKLEESHRIVREENSKLRDIMKQALNEATVVKEALEIARRENSELKDLLSDRESSLKTIKQDYECLKISEAAATDTVKELKNLLAAASASEMKGASSVDTAPPTKPKAAVKEGPVRKGIANLPSEQWKTHKQQIKNGLKDHGAHSGSLSEGVPSSGQKDPVYASLSCVSDSTVPSFSELENGEVNSYGYDHIRRIDLDGMNNEYSFSTKQKKRRPILRKFGDLLRRGSFHK